MISLSLQAFLQLLVCNRSSQNTILQQKILHSAIHIKIVLADAWAKKSNCCRNKNYSAGNLQKHPKALRLHRLPDCSTQSVARLFPSVLSMIFTEFDALRLVDSKSSPCILRKVISISFCVCILIYTLLQDSGIGCSLGNNRRLHERIY